MKHRPNLPGKATHLVAWVKKTKGYIFDRTALCGRRDWTLATDKPKLVNCQNCLRHLRTTAQRGERLKVRTSQRSHQ